MEETKSIQNMSFEQALNELEQLVKRIDTGEETLDEAIAAYERGIELKLYCEQKLAEAQLKIEVLKITPENTFELQESKVE